MSTCVVVIVGVRISRHHIPSTPPGPPTSGKHHVWMDPDHKSKAKGGGRHRDGSMSPHGGNTHGEQTRVSLERGPEDPGGEGGHRP